MWLLGGKDLVNKIGTSRMESLMAEIPLFMADILVRMMKGLDQSVNQFCVKCRACTPAKKLRSSTQEPEFKCQKCGCTESRPHLLLISAVRVWKISSCNSSNFVNGPHERFGAGMAG